MKKVEKFTLNELGSSLMVIKQNEMRDFVGGGSDTPPSVDYCLGQIENAFSPVTDGVANVVNSMSNAASAVGDWVVNNGEKIGEGILIGIGTALDFYFLKGGTAPTQGPTALPGGDGSGYGINPYTSSSSNSDFYKNGFYNLDSNVWNLGNPGSSGNNNNELLNF